MSLSSFCTSRCAAATLAVHRRRLVLDAEISTFGSTLTMAACPTLARPHAYAVGVAVQDDRAFAVAGIFRLVAARVEARIGDEIALDALNAARRQPARDLGDVARRQRRIAVAAQDDVPVHDAVRVRLGSVKRRVIAKVGAEIRHRRRRREHLRIRRRVELHRGVVREQHVAVRCLHDLDADLGATERRFLQHRDQPVA